MIRQLKILLAALVAFWGIIGAVANIWHAGLAVHQVRAVIAMTGVPDAFPHGQAIDSGLLAWIGLAVIVLAKFAGGGLCLIGALRMWRSRALPAADFQAAKQAAIMGCGIMLAMLFGLFIAAGEGYFLLSFSEIGAHALPSAFRYIGSVGIIAILLSQPE